MNIMQVFLNGLISSSIYLLIALSFWQIYFVTNFFHFAHGAIIAFGAYAVFLLMVWMKLPLVLSIPVVVAMSVILGCGIEQVIYRPLRKWDANPIVYILASLGLYTVLQNVISLVFGDDAISIRNGPVREGLLFFGARITSIQIITIVSSIVVFTSLLVFMKYARMGKEMRAVASNERLSLISGIDSDRVILWAFAIGSSLAALAGILVALDTDMTPTMGMRPFMMGVVVVVIGGMRNVVGILLASLLLGLMQNFAGVFCGSQWQDAIAFIVLLLFLLLRPQGFFGKKTRKAEV
ncbi:MAG TPA: branched-chain amino acid ABC transporter permease [Candidatus Acidoferrum sp.]|nr:branched-chain amino acid ABC transporter permease [Candidatus Acidoferrum sp.]